MVNLMYLPTDILIMLLDEYLTVYQIMFLDLAIVSHKLRPLILEVYTKIPQKNILCTGYKNYYFNLYSWVILKKMKINISGYGDTFNIAINGDFSINRHIVLTYEKDINIINLSENLKCLTFYSNNLSFNLDKINPTILNNLKIIHFKNVFGHINTTKLYEYCINLIEFSGEINFNNGKLFNRFIKKNKEIKFVNIINTANPFLLNGLEECINLENLYIHGKYTKLNIKNIIHNCSKLKILELQDFAYTKNKELYINKNNDILDEIQILSNSTYERLSLSNLNNLTDNILMTLLLKSYNTLTILEICYCDFISTYSLKNKLKLCKCLKSFKFSTDNMSEEIVDMFKENKLFTIILCCSKLQISQLVDIIDNSHYLKTFQINPYNYSKIILKDKLQRRENLVIDFIYDNIFS